MTLDNQSASVTAQARLARLVPGGAHTYAKGPDQYPADIAPIIARGRGSHVWDVDGNEFIEYGSGLRAVSLGHAHPEILDAVRSTLSDGTNFARPSVHELHAAERFLATVETVDMVKFTKNGSDATTAAIRLARAHTGRDRVAVCSDQPFFSTDDWFIGITPMSAGIPKTVQDLTVTFPYGDLGAVEALFSAHPGEIACLMLEPAGAIEPPDGYLNAMRDLAHRNGALLVLDETITGFRWSEAGAQSIYGVRPDLTVFGKAMGNGFAVSALAGEREVMELGGLPQQNERVFLLSTTHGAETHALAASMAVAEIYTRDGIAQQLHETGALLAAGVGEIAESAGVGSHLFVRGRACNLVFATLDASGEPSQGFRTLFLHELLRHGVLAPSFVVSAATSREDVERTIEAVAKACHVYRRALDTGDPDPWMGGRPVKPVFRRFT